MAKRDPARILKTIAAGRELNLAHVVGWVKQTYGKGGLRQVREILTLTNARQRLTPKDYYVYALFRPEKTAAERAAYVSDKTGSRLNLALSPLGALSQHNLFRNKLLTGLLLDRLGLPTPRVLALHGAHLALPGLPALPDAGAIAAWLGSGEALPCFGKPLDGSLGLGGVAVLAAEDGGARLRLGDGRVVDTTALAAEIARFYPRGYLFQELIRQHPDVEAVHGEAVGGLRIVTLRGPDGPAPLYAVLRMPPKGAMSDGLVGRPNGHALIDLETGRVIRAQDTGRLCSSELTEALATGKPLSELVLPGIATARKLAVDAHRVFPAHGLFGFDIVLTTEGPKINEINTDPYHSIYQKTADRGLMNPVFKPRIDAALEVTRSLADAPPDPRRRRRG